MGSKTKQNARKTKTNKIKQELTKYKTQWKGVDKTQEGQDEQSTECKLEPCAELQSLDS